ncbi:MAG: transcriptional repressor LexA [Planctomycetota bacterium]|jgi:repressor LexA
MRFTKKQLSILQFIRDYQVEHNVSPTLDEIAAQFGVSKITIHEHIEALCRKGALRKEKHLARSIEILAPEFRDDTMPLMGRIAAGVPIEAVETPEQISINDLIPTGEGLYILEAVGDSMIEDGIQSGDYVVVEKRSTARNGDTVVAILEDNEATLKRFYRDGDRIRLQPANKDYDPILVDSCEIRGVVRGVLRKY